MKKLLCFFVIAFFFTNAAHGQAPKLAIKGGMNYSSVTDSDFKSIFGYHIGIVAYYQLNESLSLKPEFIFSSQGGESFGQIYRFQYFNLPILINYKLGNAFINAGPQFGLLTKGMAIDDDYKKDITYRLKNPDCSITIGMGIFFAKNLGIEARHVQGLTEINHDMFYRGKYKNRVLQLSLIHTIK